MTSFSYFDPASAFQMGLAFRRQREARQAALEEMKMQRERYQHEARGLRLKEQMAKRELAEQAAKAQEGLLHAPTTVETQEVGAPAGGSGAMASLLSSMLPYVTARRGQLPPAEIPGIYEAASEVGPEFSIPGYQRPVRSIEDVIEAARAQRQAEVEGGMVPLPAGLGEGLPAGLRVPPSAIGQIAAARLRQPNVTAAEKKRQALLAWYASRHGLRPEQVTPQQEIDAGLEYERARPLASRAAYIGIDPISGQPVGMTYREFTGQVPFERGIRPGAAREVYDPEGRPILGGRVGYSLRQPPRVPEAKVERVLGEVVTMDRMALVMQELPSVKDTFGRLSGEVVQLLYKNKGIGAGGYGLSDEQIGALRDLQELADTDIRTKAGLVLSKTEEERYSKIQAMPTDTFEAASVKLQRKYQWAKDAFKRRLELMRPMDRSQLPAELFLRFGVHPGPRSLQPLPQGATEISEEEADELPE